MDLGVGRWISDGWQYPPFLFAAFTEGEKKGRIKIYPSGSRTSFFKSHFFHKSKPHCERMTPTHPQVPFKNNLVIVHCWCWSAEYAGSNNNPRQSVIISFAHLLPAHSEKGTEPPPNSTSCHSVSTWRKSFHAEDVLLSSELSWGLLLTGPFLSLLEMSATRYSARL